MDYTNVLTADAKEIFGEENVRSNSISLKIKYELNREMHVCVNLITIFSNIKFDRRSSCILNQIVTLKEMCLINYYLKLFKLYISNV
jgi:hypothetical protein